MKKHSLESWCIPVVGNTEQLSLSLSLCLSLWGNFEGEKIERERKLRKREKIEEEEKREKSQSDGLCPWTQWKRCTYASDFLHVNYSQTLSLTLSLFLTLSLSLSLCDFTFLPIFTLSKKVGFGIDFSFFFRIQSLTLFLSLSLSLKGEIVREGEVKKMVEKDWSMLHLLSLSHETRERLSRTFPLSSILSPRFLVLLASSPFLSHFFSLSLTSFSLSLFHFLS